MKFVIGTISILIFIVTVRFCTPLLTTFDTGCNEDHRSVVLMRSFSQERLSALHARIVELSQEKTGEQLFGSSEPFIPDDLAYLDALYINFNSADTTLMVLTKCAPSIGINLFFQHSDTGDNYIELKWPAPTRNNPYGNDSEVLWP